MKIIESDSTKLRNRRDRIIDKIKQEGYYIERSSHVIEEDLYVIKKEKGWFQPKLIVRIAADRIMYYKSNFKTERIENSFIEELETKTGLELIKVI